MAGSSRTGSKRRSRRSPRPIPHPTQVLLAEWNAASNFSTNSCSSSALMSLMAKNSRPCGTALSTALAASLVIAVIRTDQDQRVLGDVTSAHVRSLQANHLTDVQTSDQHTVKPWFNGKVDIAPPVVDLTAKGFTLLGGRLDYIDGQAVASIVYRRRTHVINLFVTQGGSSESHEARLQTMQGYNIRRWTAQGLQFFAVSDINGEELQEFVDKFEAAFQPASGT